jgi:hypothetical protein
MGKVGHCPQVDVWSDASTIDLQVAGGNEKETQWLRYNWASLSPGDISMGT